MAILRRLLPHMDRRERPAPPGERHQKAAARALHQTLQMVMVKKWEALRRQHSNRVPPMLRPDYQRPKDPAQDRQTQTRVCAHRGNARAGRRRRDPVLLPAKHHHHHRRRSRQLPTPPLRHTSMEKIMRIPEPIRKRHRNDQRRRRPNPWMVPRTRSRSPRHRRAHARHSPQHGPQQEKHQKANHPQTQNPQ